MPRGGARPNSGRKRGGHNAKSAEIAQKAASEGITPLEFMLKVMRDDMAPEGADITQKIAFHTARFEAAKAAAPYVHPRLGAIEHSGKDGGPIQISASWLQGRSI